MSENKQIEVVRKQLELIKQAASDIRGDWTDPRASCRVIFAAVKQVEEELSRLFQPESQPTVSVEVAQSSFEYWASYFSLNEEQEDDTLLRDEKIRQWESIGRDE